MTKTPVESAREEAAEYVDALDHIMRVAKASRTQTRRLKWIAERARCALEGGDWRELDLPRSGKSFEQKYKELKEYAESLETWIASQSCPHTYAKDGKYPPCGKCLRCKIVDRRMVKNAGE